MGARLWPLPFVAKVQGSYILILGRDWIHANRCVPSSLHQFLTQWVGDEDDVEVVHVDSSAYVATTDAPSLGGMMVLLLVYPDMILLIFNLLVSPRMVCTRLSKVD